MRSAPFLVASPPDLVGKRGLRSLFVAPLVNAPGLRVIASIDAPAAGGRGTARRLSAVYARQRAAAQLILFYQVSAAAGSRKAQGPIRATGADRRAERTTATRGARGTEPRRQGRGGEGGQVKGVRLGRSAHCRRQGPSPGPTSVELTPMCWHRNVGP